MVMSMHVPIERGLLGFLKPYQNFFLFIFENLECGAIFVNLFSNIVKATLLVNFIIELLSH